MTHLAGHGTLLAVVPVNGTSSRLAIVGYLLPAREDSSSPARGSSNGPAAQPPAHGQARDGLIVDAARHRVLVSGRDAGLVFQEYELLSFLTANAGRTFTRADLLASIWGDGYGGGTRTVDVHIHRLRRKLGPVHAQHVVTVRRVGYMYQPPAADSGGAF